MADKRSKADEAWDSIFKTYNIDEEIKRNGVFYITAKQIIDYREPRLMAKWDSSEQLPHSLKNRKLNILPVSRKTYAIGHFRLFEDIPKLEERVERMTHIDFPLYETIRPDTITSEAMAINALVLSGILNDFLNSSDIVATFNGRMGTGKFDFCVETEQGVKRTLCVENAQCEIDGGFESDDFVVILEAKNVVHPDFNVRQLYYPYRMWRERIHKPIRLVFCIYSNQIFRLFEYAFSDPNDYSSIIMVSNKNYSLQDTIIEMDELIRVRSNTEIMTDDTMRKGAVPFIQANSMDRVISLLENLYDNSMTKAQIAQLMAFDGRQSDYYISAGIYLGLFKRSTENKLRVSKLTDEGKRIYRLPYKSRQLELVRLMFQHRIFAEFFDYMTINAELPDIVSIANRMRELHVCGESQIMRRASSVLSWLRWIYSLTV